MIGVYHPGTSVLHRLSGGTKLAFLLVALIAMTLLVRTPIEVGAVLAVTVLGFAIAKIPFRMALAQIRPVLLMLLVIGIFQVFITGPRRALVVCGVLLISVALAALFTLTTRVTDMLDTVTHVLRPFERFGVDADRIGLLLALTIKCVPVMSGIVREVSEARRARGLEWSITALVTPVLVRALRTADALGDALIARGVDDD